MDYTALLYDATSWADGLPAEFRLFRYGVNPTKKGDFIFDEQAAESVISQFVDSGVDSLDFDINHGSLRENGPPEAYKARGWFVPEVRPGLDGKPELWAAKVQWNEDTRASLQKREFRYFSPAIRYDADSMRITRLLNIALVNRPATKGLEPLVLSDDCGPEEETNEMNELLAALSAPDEKTALGRVAELSDSLSKEKETTAKLSEELESVKAELTGVKAAQAKSEREAKVAALCADGKLAPAMREFACELSDSQLEKFLAITPSVPKKVDQSSDKRAELSEYDRKVMKDFNLTEEEFLAARGDK